MFKKNNGTWKTILIASSDTHKKNHYKTSKPSLLRIEAKNKGILNTTLRYVISSFNYLSRCTKYFI